MHRFTSSAARGSAPTGRQTTKGRPIGPQDGPLALFGPYNESSASGNTAKARDTPATFTGPDGNQYIIWAGATKAGVGSSTPVAPSLIETEVVHSAGQPAYLQIVAQNTAVMSNPGANLITGNGTSNEIDWIVDEGEQRTDGTTSYSDGSPVLYAYNALTLQPLWSSAYEELAVPDRKVQQHRRRARRRFRRHQPHSGVRTDQQHDRRRFGCRHGHEPVQLRRRRLDARHRQLDDGHVRRHRQHRQRPGRFCDVEIHRLADQRLRQRIDKLRHGDVLDRRRQHADGDVEAGQQFAQRRRRRRRAGLYGVGPGRRHAHVENPQQRRQQHHLDRSRANHAAGDDACEPEHFHDRRQRRAGGDGCHPLHHQLHNAGSIVNSTGVNATGVVLTETVQANTTADLANSTPGWTLVSGSGGAGSIYTFTVGNLNAGVSGSVVFSVDLNNSIPTGTTTVSDNVSISDAASDVASATRTTPIPPPAESKLIFSQEPPANGSAGIALSPAVTVSVEDQFGNIYTADSSSTVT